MPSILLPISKSIANRLLILQARSGVPLMAVDSNAPDDVRVLQSALKCLQKQSQGDELTIDVNNCGTAMRFLTAFCAERVGKKVILTGCERMRHRPIGDEVDLLRKAGAHISYLGEEGYPPIQIEGAELSQAPLHCAAAKSTQFISALLLIDLQVTTPIRSPYLDMTRQVMERFKNGDNCQESDWSSAAFWYEYIALHSGEIHLEGLRFDSLQGDKVVAELFTQLGVETRYEPSGITIARTSAPLTKCLLWDFAPCPDLYPAVAIACEQLGVSTSFTGLETLRIKESDRIKAVEEHKSYADHRIAMALLAADLPCDDEACVSKSYPQFVAQLKAIRSAR